MSWLVRMTGTAQDPVVDKTLRELLDAVATQKLEPDALDLERLAAVLSKMFRPGTLEVLERVLQGVDSFRKLVVDGPAAAAAIEGGAVIGGHAVAGGVSADDAVLRLIQRQVADGGHALLLDNLGTGDTVRCLGSGAKLTADGKWTDADGDSPTSNRALIDAIQALVDAVQAVIDDHEARIVDLETP